MLSNVFSLIPQKYEHLGEKASPWGWVWGAVPSPPWCSLRTTATGREEAGTPQRDDGPGPPCATSSLAAGGRVL